MDLTLQQFNTLKYRVKNLRRKVRIRTLEMRIEPRHTDKGHFYYIPALDKTFGSVSAEHRNIKDPSIRNFEKNEAIRFIKDHMPELMSAYGKLDMPVIDELMDQAAGAGVLARDNSGSIGTYIHNAREEYFHKWIESNVPDKPPGSIEDIAKSWQDKIPPEFYLSVISGCAALDSFILQQKYIPIACELYVYDAAREVAGTLDDIGLMPVDGQYQLVLMDVKSSNQLKDIYTLQVANYFRMFISLYHFRPQRILIVKTSKADRTYELEWFKPEQIKNGQRANYHLNKFNTYWDKIRDNRKKEYKVL